MHQDRPHRKNNNKKTQMKTIANPWQTENNIWKLKQTNKQTSNNNDRKYPLIYEYDTHWLGNNSEEKKRKTKDRQSAIGRLIIILLSHCWVPFERKRKKNNKKCEKKLQILQRIIENYCTTHGLTEGFAEFAIIIVIIYDPH